MVCAVWWQDAAYSYMDEMPDNLPGPELTTGFILVSNDYFINIATNVNYNEKDDSFYPVDGFIIPKKTIIKLKEIGLLHDSN